MLTTVLSLIFLYFAEVAGVVVHRRKLVQSTPPPPNNVALGTDEKSGGIRKPVVKGVIYNQEKPCLGHEMEGRYSMGGGGRL